MNRKNTIRYILTPGLLLAVLGLAEQVSAAEYFLCAGSVSKNLPDGGGVAVPMWGFAQVPDAGSFGPGCGSTATVPGPRLTIPVGEGLTIHLYNDGLPEPVSVIIPGQALPDNASGPVRHSGGIYDGRVRSFVQEAAANNSQEYMWTSLQPGSYLYQSGSHVQVQVQMGLYGGLSQDFAPGEAYDGIPYDADRDVFYSEVDPALHAAVAAGTYGTTGPTSTLNYHPRYFLLNGEPFQEGDACINTGLGQGDRILLRLFNAGLQELTPTMLGSHFGAVAEGGKAYPYARNQYAVLLQPGSTKDLLFTPPRGGSYPLIDRRLHLTNAAAANGGFQTCIEVAALAGQPVAEANGPYSGEVNTDINFSSAGSTDDGSIVSYSWDFGDGNQAFIANPAHAYTAPGSYTVSLTVTDNDGNTSAPDYTTATANQLPTADPGGPYSGTVNVAIDFDGTGSSDPDGQALTYSWDFDASDGIGTDATGATASHAYTASGIYTVTLTVNDGLVSVAQDTTATVTDVNDVPVADPDGPYSGLTDEVISFDGSASYDPEAQPLSYSWDFDASDGIGTDATGVSPGHSYAVAGDYTVTLTVNDGVQDSLPATTTASVTAPPSLHVGDLDGSSTNVPGNRWRALVSVLVHDQSDDPVAGITVAGVWNAGDGNGRTLSCVTGADGLCTLQSGRIGNAISSVTFLVTNLTGGATYVSADSHDPDGDSNGISITVVH